MAYASASDVSILCQNLLSGASSFSTSTSPTVAAVNSWLTSGCAVLEGSMAAAGYDVPPASTALVYGWLTDLNALFAAARAELSRTNVTLGPGERNRGQIMQRRFDDGLKKLLSQDLTRLGVSRSSQASLYVGGISIDDKSSWEADTDRVVPRFKREQFAFPGTQRPSGISASEF